jgi:hypothetical protein
MSTPFPLVNSDITVYYSTLKIAGAVFSTLPNGPNIIQDLVSPLYTTIPPIPPNLNNSVGSVCVTGTIFDINNTTGYYDTNPSAVLYLKSGTITYSPVILCVNKNNDYIFLPNSTNLFKIVSGTGDYLNKQGFVEIITDTENVNRQVNVYFLKTYSATASATATTIDCNGKNVTFTETASATSTISSEDAQQIAKTVVEGLVNALSKTC